MGRLKGKLRQIDGQAKLQDEKAKYESRGYREVTSTTELRHMQYRVIDLGGEKYNIESMVDTKADEEEEGSE